MWSLASDVRRQGYPEMLASTMMPEAYEEGGDVVGVVALRGNRAGAEKSERGR